MKRFLTGIVTSLLLAVVIGCSGFDSTQILIHPETVRPSETFDVAVLNLYAYLANGTSVPAEVIRDSLHLLVGLPGGWEVTEATMVVVDDLPIETLFTLQGSVFDATAMSSMLQQYKSQAVPVSNDAALPGALSGQAFTAHSVNTDTDVAVAIDNVPVWKGFSAPVDIKLEAGSKTDTGIVLDSMLALASATGMVEDSLIAEIEAMKSLPMVPDTIGVTMVPIALYLKVKAGTREGDDTLFYFSKTARMNPVPTQMIQQMMPEMADLESGDMTYVPVKVSNSAAVNRTKSTNIIKRSVAIHASGRVVHFTLNNEVHPAASVSIFNLQGSLINNLRVRSDECSVVWNGNDSHGAGVGTGTYLVRVTNGTDVETATIQLVQ